MHFSMFQILVLSGLSIIVLSVLPKSVRAVFGSIIAGLGAIFVLSAICFLAGR